MNMDFERKLTIPKEVKDMFPVSDKMEELVSNQRKEISDIVSGKSDRLLLIVGPCSADNEESVLDYLSQLKKLSDEVGEKILIVPRLYTNKPRTTGEGYKGLVHQPDPTGRPDMFEGILATRRFHMRAVGEIGFACADEMLYTENLKYIDDLVGYVTVGARSVEDQQHRLTASGLEMPVGMKNPTSGVYSVMLNAIKTAQHGHTFIYRGWEVHSYGNPLTHAILRGYSSRHGRMIPNYQYDELVKLNELYMEAECDNPCLIVDANHANSGKDPYKQPEIIYDVLKSTGINPDIKKLVKGFMIESYLEDGCQEVGGSVYGQSITDACLGFEKTRELILNLADRL